MPRKKDELTTPAEEMAVVVRELKAQAKVVNETEAMIEPVWEKGLEMMDVNKWMEAAEFADMGKYVLYAIQADERHMKKLRAPKEATRTTWSLVIMPDHEDVTGGSAEDMEQAKRFARMAYQAVHGVIVGGDA